MIAMTHQQARGLIQLAADRSLSSLERATLESHLAECQDCRIYSNRLTRLQADLQEALRNRWKRAAPEITAETIRKRSREVAVKNTLVHAFVPIGLGIVLVAALLLVSTVLHRPDSSLAGPVQQEAETPTSTELTTSESIPSTVLDQVRLAGPFPPPGIGEICPNTSAPSAPGKRQFIWPTQSHVLAGKDYSDTHPAIDLSGAVGDPVRAAVGGVVLMAGWNTWGYGNLVILDSGHGLYTLYGHLDTISVTCGQTVDQGEVIGIIGMSGNAPQPELHFQVLSLSTFIDPWSVLPPADQCFNVQYTVQERDTVERIATLFDVSVDSIVTENNLNFGVLTPGMTLSIPICPK